MNIDYQAILAICDALHDKGAHHLAGSLACASSRVAITAVQKDVMNGGYPDLAHSISEAAGLYH
jgi:hypothetical protein